MENNNNFRNLWLFDLVAMLALLFMAIILLRAEETKRTTMPVVTSIVTEDSADFLITTNQINTLYDRLVQDPYTKVIYDDFKKDKKILDSTLANSNFVAAKFDTTLDIFNRLDTLLHTRRDVGNLINELTMIRDSLLNRYLRETRIERKLIREEDLMFPVNEAVPYRIHPITGRHLSAILGDIYKTVDSYIAQGYNVIKVIGHTDPTYTAEHNLYLSRQRAEYLAQNIRVHIYNKYGFKKTYIVQASGYGEFDLLKRRARESDQDYWQRNRRVELVFSFQRFDRYIPER